MKTKNRDAVATKSKILENAIKLFAKNGFDATSMDDVAKKSGVNKAMIYYYYKNKSSLYQEVMSGILSKLHKKIEKEHKKCKTPFEKLESFIKIYASYCFKYPYFPTLVLRELSHGGKNIPNMIFGGLRDVFSVLISILKEGEEKKVFDDVNPMVIHFMIVGTLNLFCATKELREKAHSIDSSLDTCVEKDIVEISEYIYKKIKKMMEVDHD